MCFALCLSACSGLGGEPRIVATIPAEVRRPAAAIPAEQPELARGAAIFAENCTRCHGTSGQGDGELVLSGQLAAPPPDFTDPATARDQTVAAWFDVITNGRIENLMPPWRDSLSESERWSVALYTYTMGYQPDRLAMGEAVWWANCAACHGETGAGDGTRSSEFEAIPNLTDPAGLVDASDRTIFDLLTAGADGTHVFGSTLDDSERWAAVAYTRTLSLADASTFDRSVPPPTATEEVEVAAAPETVGTVRGQVVNGTQGSAPVSGLNVTLHIFDSALNEELVETPVSEDGSFVIEGISLSPDRAYVATTSYQDRTFSSEMITGAPSSAVLELPITVYETTSDPAAISINSVVAQISASANSLQVAQILSFSNPTDRVFSLDETVNGDLHPSVSIALPEGARILNTAGETERYVLSSDGTTLFDTQPVYPGRDHIVHVIYTLPYDGRRRVEMPLVYPLEGSVRLLVEPGSIRVSSEQLPPLGRETMGSLVVETYGADLSLPAGATLGYEISGSAANQTTVSQPNNLLPYVLIAAGSLSILVSAALYYLGRRTPPAAGDTRLKQMLVEQIAELDELNQNGQIDAAAYKVQRKKLKARLSSLMKDE